MMAEMGTPPKEVANAIIKSLKEEKSTTKVCSWKRCSDVFRSQRR